MHWGQKLLWVPRVDIKKCTDCGLCVQVCPHTPACICEYAKASAEAGERFGLGEEDQYFIAYDLNPQYRIRSASGGALTAILMDLLESGEIDGVITPKAVSAPMGKPHYEFWIIRSVEELDRVRSSHYYPLSYDRVLKEIKGSPGRYALLGVPCIIRGIKRLPEELREKIRYTFCLICSHNVTGRFLDCLAQKEGVKGGEEFTANLRDKSGGIPDANNFNNFFKLSDREIRRNRFQTAFTDMWRNYFFTHECCLYCPDFYGADTDLSVKDGWGRLSSDPLGISLLIARNPELIVRLRKLEEDGRLFLEQCDEKEVSKSQVQTPRFKHIEVRDRLVWKSVIRKELLRSNHPAGTTRRWWKKDSLVYWQFRVTMALADFFYNRCGHVPVRIITNGVRGMIYLPRFVWRQLLLVKKAVGGFVSPVTYLIFGLLRYPFTLLPCAEETEKVKVLISGGYGYRNTGDEAQLAAVISHWKRLCPDVELTILSPDPQYTREVHNERAKLAPRVILFEEKRKGDYISSNFWFRWRYRWIKLHMLFLAGLYRRRFPLIGAYPHEVNLLNLIADMDVLHLSGGGYLTGMTLSRLWDNMLLIRLADILSTPVILSGQTIGVFKDRTSKKLARWGLSRAKFIYLRDPEGSMSDLHSLGIKGEHIKVTFDDALFCEMADEKEIDECLKENGVDASIPYVTVNVHYFKQEPAESRQVMRRIASICDHIASKHDKQVLFIPLHPTDIDAMEEVQRNMSKNSKILDYNFDYRITKGIIGKAEILLTMKHHGIIFAMGNKVPTIAIALDDYYARKNLGALKLFDQEQWLADRGSLFSPDIVKKMLDDCFNTSQEQKETISRHLEEMRKQDGEAIKRFLEEYLKL